MMASTTRLKKAYLEFRANKSAGDALPSFPIKFMACDDKISAYTFSSGFLMIS